jgi:hypothetical protein
MTSVTVQPRRRQLAIDDGALVHMPKMDSAGPAPYGNHKWFSKGQFFAPRCGRRRRFDPGTALARLELLRVAKQGLSDPFEATRSTPLIGV